MNKLRLLASFAMLLSAVSLISFSSISNAADETTPVSGRSRGMMGQGYGMGLGMMNGQGYSMMGGGCALGAMDAKVEVKDTKDGAVLTLVGKTKQEIARIQKMAQIIKLQHEVDSE
jgi:hypothetical protein